jgi:hypothetical protein
MRGVLALLVLLVGLPANAAAPYEGRWAEDAAWCARTRQNGTDEIPITITARAIEQFASICMIQSVRKPRGGWWLYTLCRDEGQDQKEKPTPVIFVVRVDGERLYLRDTTGIRNFLRCPTRPQ